MSRSDPAWPPPSGPAPAEPADLIHDVLRHGDLLGDEVAPPAGRRTTTRAPLDVPRVVAGLAASAVAFPAVLWLAPSAAPAMLPLALLLGATGLLASYASRELTRREVAAEIERFRLRTARLLPRLEGDDGGPARGAGLDVFFDNLTRSVEGTLEGRLRMERDAFISTITSLVSALEARDPYTRNHSSSVAKLSVQIARRLGLDRAALYELHLGGLLHDVGKIGIRDAILLKPAGLTRDEYEVMKTHPELGARILSGLPGFERVRATVLHHHEMYDGRGYPEGLAGNDIPLGARVVAVADTYLSLVEDRPYRRGRDLGKVVAELRRVAGRQLDPAAVEALLALLDEETRAGRGLFIPPPIELPAAQPPEREAA